MNTYYQKILILLFSYVLLSVRLDILEVNIVFAQSPTSEQCDDDDDDGEQSTKMGSGCTGCFEGASSGYVYISTSDGIQKRTTEGLLVKIYRSGEESQFAGLATDLSGRLYAADVYANNLLIFEGLDETGKNIGTGLFNPVSMEFDFLSNINIKCLNSNEIKRFDYAGKQISSVVLNEPINGYCFYPDRNIMLYSNKNGEIKSSEIYSANSRSLTFSNGFTGNGYSMKILTKGNILVADGETIVRLDSSGKLIQTYDVPAHDYWYALCLDPDGKSFWCSDFCNSNVWKFDIETGKQLTFFNAGTPPGTVCGLAARNELNPAEDVILSSAVLNLKVIFEEGSEKDKTIAITLRNASSPYDEIARTETKVEDEGKCTPMHFSGIVKGRKYFVVVNHRHSIERWSLEAVSFDVSPVSLDFSGENMLLTGDVNSDGIIDGSDLMILDNLAFVETRRDLPEAQKSSRSNFEMKYGTESKILNYELSNAPDDFLAKKLFEGESGNRSKVIPIQIAEPCNTNSNTSKE